MRLLYTSPLNEDVALRCHSEPDAAVHVHNGILDNARCQAQGSAAEPCQIRCFAKFILIGKQEYQTQLLDMGDF